MPHSFIIILDLSPYPEQKWDWLLKVSTGGGRAPARAAGPPGGLSRVGSFLLQSTWQGRVLTTGRLRSPLYFLPPFSGSSLDSTLEPLKKYFTNSLYNTLKFTQTTHLLLERSHTIPWEILGEKDTQIELEPLYSCTHRRTKKRNHKRRIAGKWTRN